MNCLNCNKELKINSRFCPHCGEEIENMNYSNNQSDQAISNNQTTQNQANLNIDTSASLKSLKELILKNKVVSAAVCGVIGIMIIALTAVSILKGSPVSDSKIKSYMVGKSVNFNSVNANLTDENISDIEIVNRDSVKKKSDVVNGKMTVKLDNATVVSKFNLTLYYNEDKNEWVTSSIYSDEIISIEPSTSLEDNIKSILVTNDNRLRDSKTSDSIKLSEDIIKEITDIKITDGSTATDKDVSCTILLSNGIVENKYDANFSASFSLKDGTYNISSGYVSGTSSEGQKLCSNISDEDKKNFILSAFENSYSCTYKYDNTSELINIQKDSIKDLKINNFMEFEKNQIRAEIEGESSCGDAKSIKFSGVVYLDSSLVSSYYSSSKKELTVSSVELNDVNLDSIKKDILDKKLDNAPITVDAANTLTLGAETEKSKLFDKEYNAKITIDGQEKDVILTITLKYDSTTKTYNWKLYYINLKK